MLNKLTRGGFMYRAGATMLSSSTALSSSLVSPRKSLGFLSSGMFSGGASRNRVSFPLQFHRASSVRCFASSGVSDRIQVQNPIVEMDGEILRATSVLYLEFETCLSNFLIIVCFMKIPLLT